MGNYLQFSPGQLRHLITTQPGHPTPRTNRQTDLRGPDPIRVDNHRSVAELGITYRPPEETVLDHYESWLRTRHRGRT